mmetsp:Transcript_35053/g.44289  ORF Transcript_35053/g.44289 Transcript_35053/m.44289 type:complete len:368 (-) Transcript_35053:275-1378(-)
MADFFFETDIPASLKPLIETIKVFLDQQVNVSRPVVLVSSGGSTVPLEKNTVRFIDNFSTGVRGAISTEYFLELGYAVIYLHRTGVAMPFSRVLQQEVSCHMDHALMECLELTDGDNITLCPRAIDGMYAKREKIRRALEGFERAKKDNALLTVPFLTVEDYLWLLKEISCEMNRLGKYAMLYLAAAISDFYIPTDKMTQHKIQSAEGPLQLELDQVPKCLGMCTQHWAPNAFCVSFKLETDLDILTKKALGAIEKYKVNLVVANELHSRKSKVILITKDDQQVVEIGLAEVIEEKLVEEVASKHYTYIGEAAEVFRPPEQPVSRQHPAMKALKRYRWLVPFVGYPALIGLSVWIQSRINARLNKRL